MKMLYVAKFIALWLLPPGLFVLIFLALGGYLRYQQKHGRSHKWVAICCLSLGMILYLLSTNIVGRLLLRPLEYAYTPETRPVDAIILLGGGATPQTPDVSGKGNLGPFAANRLLTALQLQKQSGVPILTTGGQVFADSGNEAEITKRIIVNLGVAADKVLVENKARNTKENALYSLKIAQERGYKSVYLVTSAFHIPRSMLNFERAFAGSNIAVIPYPCDYLTSPTSPMTFFAWLPQFGGLEMSCIALHEYLGILALQLF